MSDAEDNNTEEYVAVNPADDANANATYNEKSEEQKEEQTTETEAATVELQAMPTKAPPNYANSTNSLQGKYLELEINGKIMQCKLNSVSDAPKDYDSTAMDIMLLTSGTQAPGDGETQMIDRKLTIQEQREEDKKEQIYALVPDSTNAWLYIEDTHVAETDEGGCCACFKSCTDDAANKFIAIFVICIQIAAYITMVYFLAAKRDKEFESREENCYGPNCSAGHSNCMDLTTGGLTSILLVGFLWADVVNTAFLMRKGLRFALASSFVLCELFTAIICGFLVGIYSETDFDAIGGAVGILFVHDLDEKVFGSMQVFRGSSFATFKKVLAISLWLIISVIVALELACTYPGQGFFGTCKETEFQCADGSGCIWEGFVCNGVSDCGDSSDEFSGLGHGTCDYALIVCPGTNVDLYTSCVNALSDDATDAQKEESCGVAPTKFKCQSDGSCIDIKKRCDGNLNCDDGSDEGRSQNCQEVISKIKCSEEDFVISNRDNNTNDTYHKKWSGVFKCNNGQCIDAEYACDGVAGDCVDGSDEYPSFYKKSEWPFLRTCPYAQLIDCSDDQVLCKVSGKCISKSLVCDGNGDCADGSDELLCEYSCVNKVKKMTHFQCGGQIASINATHIVGWDGWFESEANATTIEAHTEAYDSNSDISKFFDGSTGLCIPISWRCDGTNDCEEAGSDEELCSLFSCADSDYQCTDTGSCIPKSWLCDGIQDCENNEDESQSVCKKAGVSTQSECIQMGYFYECTSDSSICLNQESMCDGYQDCPGNEDENQANCDAAVVAASSTTTTYQAGSGDSLTCGASATGTITTQWSSKYFSFEFPNSYTDFRITTCNTGTTGPNYLYVHDSTLSNIIAYYSDTATCDCMARSTVLGVASGDDSSTYTVIPGTSYTVELYAGFTGNFEIKVECGSSEYSGDVTPCVDSYVMATTPWR